jgi:hypothetical protein
MNPKFFPTLLILLDVAAAAVYLSHGDVRKVVYWLSAAALTTAVTW